MDLDLLISSGHDIREGLRYVPSPSGVNRMYKVYTLSDSQGYYSWVSLCLQFLERNFDGLCIQRFKEGMKQFEDRHNYPPQPLEKMIGVLESCKLMNELSQQSEGGNSDLIKLIERDHKKYNEISPKEYNSNEDIALYLKWYEESLSLFIQYFPSDNEDLLKFRSVDNSVNGFGLRDNYNGIHASYFVMMNQIKRGKPLLEGANNTEQKKKSPLLFISHSSKDIEFVEPFVELLQSIGFNKTNMFCSSIAGFGISEGNDIYETLKEKFQENNIYVVFILSDNYYNSPACLNEMGAAWVLQTDYSSVLSPGFNVPSIKGAINPNKLAIVIDDDRRVRSILNDFRDNMMERFGLEDKNGHTVWETSRDKFLSKIEKV